MRSVELCVKCLNTNGTHVPYSERRTRVKRAVYISDSHRDLLRLLQPATAIHTMSNPYVSRKEVERSYRPPSGNVSSRS